MIKWGRWLSGLLVCVLLLGGLFGWMLVDAVPLQIRAQGRQLTPTWGPIQTTPQPQPAITDLPSTVQTIVQTVAPGLQPDPASTLPAPLNLSAEPLHGGLTDGTLRRIAVPILMYHYISVPPEGADVYRLDLSVTPENFRMQMQYLASNGYNTVSLYDVNEALRWGAPLPANPVVLTFDDGYLDAYTNAFPILQEFGLIGTFFVVTTRLDERHPAYINWEQAAEMAAAGMSIESHTKDHLDVRGRDFDFYFFQLQGSIDSIEGNTGQRARFFAYPAGRWDETVLNILPLFDIWGAVITENGIEHTTDNPYLMRRVRISGETTLPEFAALVEWAWGRSD